MFAGSLSLSPAWESHYHCQNVITGHTPTISHVINRHQTGMPPLEGGRKERIRASYNTYISEACLQNTHGKRSSVIATIFSKSQWAICLEGGRRRDENETSCIHFMLICFSMLYWHWADWAIVTSSENGRDIIGMNRTITSSNGIVHTIHMSMICLSHMNRTFFHLVRGESLIHIC